MSYDRVRQLGPGYQRRPEYRAMPLRRPLARLNPGGAAVGASKGLAATRKQSRSSTKWLARS